MTTIETLWRGEFANDEVNSLHAEAFHHPVLDIDWAGQCRRHSLGWVTGRQSGELFGFANVAWDGGVHAFLVDVIVRGRVRRSGLGTRLVAIAADQARAAGCEWLHVDFDDELRPFYFGSCGFRSTSAGLIALWSHGEDASDQSPD